MVWLKSPKSQLSKTFCGLKIPVADLGFPQGGGANSPGGAPTYDFAKFSQKLHEIERIWAPRGGARPKFYYVDPPLNPLSIKEVMSQNVCVCSFPIFDIHSLTPLMCTLSIFDIFDIALIFCTVFNAFNAMYLNTSKHQTMCIDTY